MLVVGVRSTSASMLLPVARSSMNRMYEPANTQPVVQVLSWLAKNDPKAPTAGLPSPSSWKAFRCNRPSATGVPDTMLPVGLKPPLAAEGRAMLPTLTPLAASTARPPAGDVNGSQVPPSGIG